MKTGYWQIVYTAVSDTFTEPNETDLEHIGKMVAEGYTEGEICSDTFEEDEQPNNNGLLEINMAVLRKYD